MSDNSSQPQAPVNGTAPVDPTRNVLDKVDDAVQRQDDLRDRGELLLGAKLDALDKRVTTEFALRDTAADRLSLAESDRVAAALQAQKEAAAAQNESNAAAIAKSEAGFTKQIDGIGAQIAAAGKAVEDKIADINKRLDRGEGREGLSTPLLVAIAATVAGVVGFILQALLPG